MDTVGETRLMQWSCLSLKDSLDTLKVMVDSEELNCWVAQHVGTY